MGLLFILKLLVQGRRGGRSGLDFLAHSFRAGTVMIYDC